MISYNQFENVPENGIIAKREGEILRIWFDIEEHQQPKPEVEETTGMIRQTADEYVCQNVDVKGGTYADIVSAIINDRYSADDVQALQANYIEAKDSGSDITDEKRYEYLEEYETFQQWRKKAKEVAKEVLNHN